jgi:hypothetical protein
VIEPIAEWFRRGIARMISHSPASESTSVTLPEPASDLPQARMNRTSLWALLLAAAIAWLLFLFFQRGNPWDESEHSHAAWLISQGEKPLEDFFQHHQPLLWSLLALYYRVGFTGAGVLIWGRVLVLLAAATSATALLTLGRDARTSFRLRQCLGCAVFAALTVMLNELFVIRPETIAAAMFLGALAVWTRKQDSLSAAVAGIIAALAVYASPRMALLGGFFLLMGSQTVHRWLVFIAAGLGTIGVYTLASGFSLRKVLFNLRFSSYLQSVGDGPAGMSARFWVALLFCTCVPLAVLALNLPSLHRRRGGIFVAYAVLIFVACHISAGLFRYQQAYAPFLLSAAIAGAWIGARLAFTVRPQTALAPILVALLWFPSSKSLRMMRPTFDFLASVRVRNRLAALVPPGETVLLYTRDSPITVKSASYYGIPMWDGQDRLCRAVRGFQSKSDFRLPPCDFYETLQSAKPYLTESDIGPMLSARDVPRAKAFINQNYRPLDLGVDAPSYMRGQIVRRAHD